MFNQGLVIMFRHLYLGIKFNQSLAIKFID